MSKKPPKISKVGAKAVQDSLDLGAGTVATGGKQQTFESVSSADLKSELDKQAEQFKELLTKRAEDFDKKIEEKEARTTEILTLFIALFTFISVNITIFTRVADAYTAVWFMGLITVFTTFLVSYLLIVIRGDKKRGEPACRGLWLSLLALLSLLLATHFLQNPKLNPLGAASDIRAIKSELKIKVAVEEPQPAAEPGVIVEGELE